MNQSNIKLFKNNSTNNNLFNFEKDNNQKYKVLKTDKLLIFIKFQSYDIGYSREVESFNEDELIYEEKIKKEYEVINNLKDDESIISNKFIEDLNNEEISEFEKLKIGDGVKSHIYFLNHENLNLIRLIEFNENLINCAIIFNNLLILGLDDKIKIIHLFKKNEEIKTHKIINDMSNEGVLIEMKNYNDFFILRNSTNKIKFIKMYDMNSIEIIKVLNINDLSNFYIYKNYLIISFESFYNKKEEKNIFILDILNDFSKKEFFDIKNIVCTTINNDLLYLFNYSNQIIITDFKNHFEKIKININIKKFIVFNNLIISNNLEYIDYKDKYCLSILNMNKDFNNIYLEEDYFDDFIIYKNEILFKVNNKFYIKENLIKNNSNNEIEKTFKLAEISKISDTILFYKNLWIISFESTIMFIETNSFDIIKQISVEQKANCFPFKMYLYKNFMFYLNNKEIVIINWDNNFDSITKDLNEYIDFYLQKSEIVVNENIIYSFNNDNLYFSIINFFNEKIEVEKFQINEIKSRIYKFIYYKNIFIIEDEKADLFFVDLLKKSIIKKIKIDRIIYLIYYDDILVLSLNNKSIIFICLKNYEIIKTLNIHNEITTVLLKYKNYLISGSEDNNIKIIDLNNNYNILKILKIHDSPIKSLILYNDNLISLSNDEFIKKTDLLTKTYNTSNLIKACENFNKLFINNNILYNVIKYNYDNEGFNVWMNFNYFFNEIKTINFEKDEFLDFEINENILITYSNYEFKFIEMKNNFDIKNKIKLHEVVKSFIIYEQLLIASLKDNTIVFINMKTNFEIAKTFNFKNREINNLIKYKDLLIFSLNENIKIINILNYEEIKIIDLNGDIIELLINYNNFLISYDKKIIKIIDSNQNYKNTKSLKIHKNIINCIIGYKNLLITGSDDKKIIYTNLLNYKNEKILKIHENGVKNLINYNEFLISSSFNIIKITNLNNFDILKVWSFDKYCIFKMKIFEDVLISGTKENKIKIIYLKKNPNIFYINELLYKFYDNIKNFEKLNEEIENINIVIKNENQIFIDIIINERFKLNYYIIKETENKNLLLKSLDYFGYDKLYYHFNKEENLFYLIIIENKLKIFLEPLIIYFIKNNIKYQLDYELFIKIFKEIKNDNKLLKIFFDYVLEKSTINENFNLNDSINIDDNLIIKSDNIILSEQNLKEKEYFSSKNINKNKEIEIYNFSFKTSDLLSENKELFKTLNDSTNEIKITNIKYLVNYFFDKLFYFKFVNLIIFLLLIISWVLSLNNSNNISIYIYLFSVVYFLIYELLQIILNSNSYFKEISNYFDLLLIIYNIVIFVLIQLKIYNNINLIIMLLFYINSFKWLIFLKSLNFLRKQIRLIIKVLVNTIQFISFIFIIILYLSFIDFLYNISTTFKFYLSLFKVYGNMLGTFSDDFSNYNTNNFIELLVNTYIFNIMLLNLFISVISEIFNDYNTNQELYNIQEKLSLLIRYSTIFSIFEKFKSKIQEQYYFFIIKEKREENQDNQSLLINKFKKNIESKVLNEINNLEKRLEQKIFNKLNNYKKTVIDQLKNKK